MSTLAQMVNINYEIPADLHRALKIRAAEEGVTLKELIIRLLMAGLSTKGQGHTK